FQLPRRIVGVLLRQRGEVRAPFEPGMEPVDQHLRVEAGTRLRAGDEDLADLASYRQTRLMQVLGTGIAAERAEIAFAEEGEHADREHIPRADAEPLCGARVEQHLARSARLGLPAGKELRPAQ